jgi:hypothetical protein
MMITPQKAIHYERYEFKNWKSFDAETIVESPVSLTVNGQVWLTFMCTPVDLEAMSVGFLYNEGIIESMEEVEDVRLCEHGDNVDVWLNRSVDQFQSWRRTSVVRAGSLRWTRWHAPMCCLGDATVPPETITPWRCSFSRRSASETGRCPYFRLGDGERLSLPGISVGTTH